MPKATLRQRIAAWLAPGRRTGQRLYQNARVSRGSMSFGAGGTSSADAELSASLAVLRARSRQMVRDSAYAKRAKTVIVNNVIGSGMGMQAQVRTVRDELATRVNNDIESAWIEWCHADSCHTGGVLHFADIERLAMGEVFEAGEVLIRLHSRPFGRSRVPLALEVIEAERLATDHHALAGVVTDNEVRMGVEVDRYQRPVAYWLRQRHGGDVRARMDTGTDQLERVPADQVLHLKITTRWPQTRGEPWLHTVLRKLDDMSEYTGAEVSAARASAYYFATITKPDDGTNPLVTGEDSANRPVVDIEPLMVQELAPGEQLQFHTPNRPNAALDPFLRYMLREVAAGASVSYESLSRDYSQSNYSSSRLALLDDRDSYRALQGWWIRSLRQPLHRAWLQQAVLARVVPAVPVEAYGVDRARYEAVLFKARGWSWVDPTKEVAAYKEAILAGMTTLTDVIAATANGLDIEDIVATRKRELQMLADAGIKVDTTFVPEPPAAAVPPKQQAAADDDDESAAADRAARIKRVA